MSRLNEPVLALELDRTQLKRLKPVYHLSIAAAKDPQSGALVDRYLSDEQWADIAREYMNQIGLAKRGDDTGVRWVVVRHADEHVHVIATLARQDGRSPRLSNDYYRSRAASLIVEARYGLFATPAASGTTAAQTSRAESRKHQATTHRRGEGLPGPVAPDREVLRRQVRTAAAGAGSLPEFLGRLRADGLLVRERMSERNPGEITGYAVALPDRYDTGGKPIYFGGGNLAPDLTIPRLLRRWPGGGLADAAPPVGADWASTGTARAGRADRFGLTPTERLRIWTQASRAAGNATEQITASALSDPASAADAARAASDFLAAAGRVVEGRRGGPLSAAALAYDEAGWELFGRHPEPTAAGRGLRAAGRLLLGVHVAKPSETKQLLALLAQLAALADAVTRLRESQQRAAQAAAARQAAEQLRAVAARYQPPVASDVSGRAMAGHGRTGGRGRPSVVLPAPTIPRSRRR